MTPQLYDPCSCGSGKKFKWCCQPIYAGIEHALEQEASGQHDTALRIIEQVVREHPGNPEVWGQKARLLYVNHKPEEAEEALQKAFEINPNYPFGLLLRAQFRFNEGEIQGALLLARRAADAYDPLARDQLSTVYELIFQCEERLHRPVAARAALRRILHYQPANEEVRHALETAFGDESPWPLSARKDYQFLGLAPRTDPARRAAWARLLGDKISARFSEAAQGFETLTQEDSNDAAAWYNLGLCRAWLGDNLPAVEALDRYIDLETDEQLAADATALQEVLRLGQGMEDHSDHHEYALVCGIRHPEPVNNLLREWIQGHRLLPIKTEESNVFFGILLETNTASLVTVGRPASDTGRLAGYLTIAGNLFQITSPVKEPFDRLKNEVRQGLGLGLGELPERRGPGQFRDVAAEALIFPTGPAGEDFGEKVIDHAARFFEDTWIHRPCRSLSGITPVDAVGSSRLRKKVRGIIQFLAECSRDGALAGYDFDRLRRKLGLQPADAPATPAPTGAAPGIPADISALGAGELAGLDLAALSDDQLEQAYQTAHRLNAEELTAHFAQALVSRPARADKPDRFPWFSYLIQKALRDGDTTAALDQVNEGERQDCENNGGKRRNDFELRRAQVHVKRGEADEAFQVYQSLIERVPDNLGYRGDAAEAMLRLKQPQRALQIAEAGLEAARRQNDRDNEGRLQDLVGAARRQGG
jgi:tetratricopeptide (TPR) repeat protein